jgi:molecular chaperone DnaK (HSP70)
VVDPSRLVREFKRRIGDHVPVLVAGTPYSPQALTARLLSQVVSTASERMGEPPAEVVLTYPANWREYKRDLLNQVIALADVGEASTCTEPQAAAIQYAARERLEPGARVAVYDLGGGTFDVCILEKTETGFRILGSPEGIEHLGGIDFDEAVFRHVLASQGASLADLDTDDPEVRAALGRLRRDCVEAKEALSTEVDTPIRVALPTVTTSVHLTRAEFETLIGPALDDTITAMNRALRSADTTPDQLAAIVLVGGSSRIPLVSHLLQSHFGQHGVAMALDTHPKHDVALGAAQFRGTQPTDAAAPATVAKPTAAPPAAPAEPPATPRSGIISGRPPSPAPA